MELRSGLPYWLLLNGLGEVAPPLTSSTNCDVLIVGSGVTGALLGWTLAREGVDVIIVDQRDLGLGSTVASTALLLTELDTPLHELQKRFGPEAAARAFQLGHEAILRLEEAGAHIGVPVERMTSVQFLRDEGRVSVFRDEFQARRLAGLDVDWLDAGALRQAWGIAGVAGIGTEDAAQLDPYAFTHGLLRDAVATGARVYDRTAVTDVSSDGEGATARIGEDVVVSCRHLVHAIGYEAARALPKKKVTLRTTFAAISEPLPPTARPRCLFWEFAEDYLYGRPVGDRLLVGGEDTPFRNEERSQKEQDRAVARLTEALADVLPGVPFEPAFTWSGTFATTPDGLGYVDALPGRPRELVALGFGGNGITFGAVAADILTQTIAGRHHPDAPLFRLDRS